MRILPNNLNMTQLLISVQNVQEAAIALECGVDIIDLKDPNAGALGALPLSEIQSIIHFIDARKQVSATIGDVPMQPDLIKERVFQLQNFSLDYIKIGFFEMADYQACLDELRKLTSSGQQLIAVLFAELKYPEDLLQKIKQAGFSGVMLDTMHKNGTTYLAHYSVTAFENFISKVIANDLLFGLAGSLQLSNVKVAKKWKLHFMGFRGGVCIENRRQSELDRQKIYAIKNALQN
jgi:uncharacterized protein (UPF0264 family)